MRATWRVLPVWPYPDGRHQDSRFKTTWASSLALLDLEIGRIDGSGVEIGVVAAPEQFSLAGQPKGNFKVLHPGVEVSFDVPKRGRLTFHTNVFPKIHDNVHAVARGLEALRLVERYGITTADEQYVGFQQLASGAIPNAPDPERGKRLAEAAGGLKAAIKAHHPDTGGDARDLADVMAYKAALGA